MDDLSWFHERYLRHGRIFHAHLDLTGRCPLRCRHCYLGAPPGDELTLEELRGVLRQLADLGALSLLLSGGEVFLRQDLQDILAAARGLGFSLLVKTSGALCGEAEVEALASLGVRTVHVSLYSHRGPVHDAVTGVSGSFGRSLGTVRALQDRGVDVQVVVTLLQGYEMDFAAVRDGLRSLGVRRVAINELAEIGCATACSLEDLRLEDGALREQWRAAFGEHPPHRGGSPADPVCLAGRSSVYIGPDGTVRPCLDWPLALGNVRERPLAELWRDHPALAGLRSLTWGSLEGSCARCGDRPWCFFCPARALRETGSSTGAAPSLCRRAAIWRSLEGSP